MKNYFLQAPINSIIHNHLFGNIIRDLKKKIKLYCNVLQH